MNPIFAGSVKGSVRTSTNGKKYSAFQGVPYAVPPTGKRRFARPEPLNKGTHYK